jgi:F-type H+-transporting ATPase subunit a
LDLNIKNIWVLNIGGQEVWITETIVNTWIIMLILIDLAIFVRIKLRSFKTVPEGVQNVIETIVEIYDSFALDALGDKLSYHAPWFFTVFAFILSSSIFSIYGLRAPTADWATTFALALASLMLMFYTGFRHRKFAYLKSFVEPNILFLPLNLIGELSKPISMSFRLFGNMLSGTIILTLYYGLTPYIAQIGIPIFFHAFFDVLFGALQAYIFVMLSLMYIRNASE